MDVTVFSLQDREPADEHILSFWRLVFSPDQLRWNPEDSPDLARWDDQRVLRFYRGNLAYRPNQFGFWASRDGTVVGYVGLCIPNEHSRSHCGELGFGVDQRYQRQGIGLRLLTAVEELATKKGLHRLECSCFAANIPAMRLLLKAGFTEEGRKRQPICSGETYSDQVFFGKLLRSGSTSVG